MGLFPHPTGKSGQWVLGRWGWGEGSCRDAGLPMLGVTRIGKPQPPALGFRALPRPVTTLFSGLFPRLSWGHPSLDPRGLPGNPRGPLSAHELLVPAARREAGRPQLSFCSNLRLFSTRSPQARPPPRAARLGSCWPGRAAGSQTRPGALGTLRRRCGLGAGATLTNEDSSRPVQLHSANSARGAVCAESSSVYSALIPREGEGHPIPWLSPGPAEKLNPGVGRRALCPPARRPARLISRRLLAQLANLSSPFLTLPG